ncbi:MAG: glycosyltransferase family 2 protein [Lentisphaeria bacterium]|nr:glycosyltransferase family 2 protein [Lentisphaeria bacterium]
MSENENRKIRLSIYIPCHAQTRWFGEMLESLLNSGYHFRDTEILICDDASPDGGDGDTARDYAARHPDLIRVIRNDVSLGAARCYQQLAMAAKGEYLMPFDSDDVFVPFDIDANLKWLDQHPGICATYGKRLLFDREKGYHNNSAGGDFSAFSLLFSPRVSHPGMIIRATDFRNTWGYLLPDGEPCNAADLCLWAGLAMRKMLFYTGEVRALARVHSHQLSQLSRQDYPAEIARIRQAVDDKYPALSQPLKERKPFQIPETMRLPATLVLGNAFVDAGDDIERQMTLLKIVETILPADYTVQECRLKILMGQKKYQEALAECVKLMSLHAPQLYIASMALSFACDICHVTGMDGRFFEDLRRQRIEQLVKLTPAQKKLLDDIIERSRRLDREQEDTGDAWQSAAVVEETAGNLNAW